MGWPVPRLRTDETGAAAAEMALVTPLLLIIMFGALESGKFFWDEHIVVKAVRDGARFAGRQKFADMACDGEPANEEAIKNLTRLGTPVDSGTGHAAAFLLDQRRHDHRNRRLPRQ